MSIIREHQLIFIHTAKTAGTSISDYFNSERGHHQVSQYLRDLGEKFIQYRSFVVVRDPVDRFISAWNMVSSDSTVVDDYREKYPEFSLDLNEALQTDVASRLRADPKIGWFWAQSELLLLNWQPFNDSKEQFYIYVPTFVLFFDNLQNDFKRLCHINSIKFDSSKFLHLQSSNGGPYQKSDLTAASLDVIKSCYKDDYVLIYQILSANAIDPARKTENLDIERGLAGLFYRHVPGLFKVVKK